MLVSAGCAENSRDAQRQQQDTLNVGYAALEQRQFDRAMAAADQYLTRTPTGAGSAEAHYLRGRILEERPASSQQESAANWQQAKAAYEQALAAQPTPAVEWRAHAGLGNIAYFQEDYGTSLAELGAAYDRLSERAVQRSAEMGASPEVKAWILYRIGLCQQRLGRMEDADRSFAAVQEQFGGTVPAQRAREHQGQHQFWVQVATFADGGMADRAADELKRDGKNVVKLKDTAGHFVVRVGPVPTYQAARNMKTMYAARYPAAVIVP
jgi:outer membrane protein assembly factor BamD (BamD/ComL family)